jgi:DNA-directed RNA polymerase subunit N (RpoN/RPB10)
MIGEIVCFTCGEVISHLVEEYIQKIKEREAKGENKKNKTNKEILDDMNLKRFCCRTRVIGSVDLTAEFPFTF